VAEQIGVTHLFADNLGHLEQRALIRSHGHALPLAAGFDHHQGEEILGAHRALELAIEHEVKRRGRQNFRALFVKRTARHDYEALSRPFSLIL
jgi:hypothetical protein